MAFTLMPLPYDKGALAPDMSANTLEFHYGKHHKTYVDTLNKLTQGTPLEKASLEEIIENTAEDESKRKIFNNAGQVWNHNLFWNSMQPKNGSAPKGDFAKEIDKAFGSLGEFKT